MSPALGSVVSVVAFALWCAPAVADEKQKPEEPAVAIVGSSMDHPIVPDLSKATVKGQRRLWTEVVVIRNATFLKPHFVDFNLRAGDTLTLRSGTDHVVEVLRDQGPKGFRNFYGLSAFGDTLLLEFEYSHDYDRVPFTIDFLVVGDVDLFTKSEDPESICSPADFEDVICYQADSGKWANVLASVGVMSVGGNPGNALFCSGSNVSSQNFVLTNDHCLSSQADCNNSEFVFKYYNTSCGGGQPTNDWQSFRCDQVVATSPFQSCDQGLNDLDFSLSSVIGDPAATFGFVQPDPVAITDGEAIYIVQHPAGRPHEIAHGSGANVDADGTVLRYYDTLDTEGGSSGSPIFREADHKLIGLHHCGGCSTAGVGNRGMLMSDIYPHIQSFLCSDNLELSFAGVDPLQEVSGNGDAVLDPGEIWSFVPKVRNNHCHGGTALGVTADIVVNAGSVTPLLVLDPVASFGDVAAEATVAAQFPIRFEVGVTAPCGDFAILDMTNLSASNAGPFADTPAVVNQQLGAREQTTLFYEDFSGGLGNWDIKDNGAGTGPAQTWTTNNPGGRGLPLVAPFAICDSDAHGELNMNEKMLSPRIDCTGQDAIFLQFSHDFDAYTDEICKVSVRSGATADWVDVAQYTLSDTSGTVQLDITAYAQGQDDLQVRFWYYNANYEWWWAVDDVYVIGDNGFGCSSKYFNEYGTPCAGGGGFAPGLHGAGVAAPGNPVSVSLDAGLPGSLGLLALSLSPADGTGCFWVTPPFSGLIPMNLDGNGEAVFNANVPAGAPLDFHVYLQWLGLDNPGPISFSNGLDVHIQ